MDLLWSAIELFARGGWLMVPLALCSVVMWTLIVERVAALRRLSPARDLDVRHAVHAVETGRLEAETIQNREDGLCARVVQTFLRQRSGDPTLDRRILRQCADAETPALRRYLPAIAVLGTTAPLLGLLGTVIGMVETFDVISRFGTGNARAMAGGISVALITTQTGLTVAVPGLILSAVLRRRARRLELRLREITSLLERHVGGSAAARSTPC